MTVRGATLDSTLPLDWAAQPIDGELRFVGKQIKKRWNDIF